MRIPKVKKPWVPSTKADIKSKFFQLPMAPGHFLNTALICENAFSTEDSL